MALRINETRFREMSQSPSGPVGKHFARQGVRIESAAKQIATEEGLVRTGRYRASIGWRLLSIGGGLVLRIQASAPQSRILERGSPPHRILPRHPKEALWWTTKPNTGSRGWYTPDRPLSAVDHPGSRPYRVLARAVLRVLRGGLA
jgi:hypothetical protein